MSTPEYFVLDYEMCLLIYHRECYRHSLIYIYIYIFIHLFISSILFDLCIGCGLEVLIDDQNVLRKKVYVGEQLTVICRIAGKNKFFWSAEPHLSQSGGNTLFNGGINNIGLFTITTMIGRSTLVVTAFSALNGTTIVCTDSKLAYAQRTTVDVLGKRNLSII